jgi:hypothetical protein
MCGSAHTAVIAAIGKYMPLCFCFLTMICLKSRHFDVNQLRGYDDMRKTAVLLTLQQSGFGEIKDPRRKRRGISEESQVAVLA